MKREVKELRELKELRSWKKASLRGGFDLALPAQSLPEVNIVIVHLIQGDNVRAGMTLLLECSGKGAG